MQARIIRNVSLSEVMKRYNELEKKYHGSLSKLSDRLMESRLNREEFEDYVEWSRMLDALKAYGEGEDFDYFTEETIEFSLSEISEFTPRRIELLDKISRIYVNSINELAARTGRDVKNVYNDLKALEKLGFVRLVKRGRRTSPELLVHEITLLLS